MTDTDAPTTGATALLGEIVTWDMGAREIPLASVRQALDDAGLPQDAIGDLRTQTAFQRAVKELREGRAIDKVHKEQSLIVFQFTRKTLDEARVALDFAFEAKCSLDTNTGHIECQDSPEIEDHARRMFAHAVEHRTTSDVTRMVQRMFATHADLYPINPRKGVAYFVPEQFRGFSGQMEDFLSALGGSLLRFPVPKGTPEGTRAVKESVEAGLRALSDEIEEAVNAWDEKTRGATMEHAIERWQLIKHKAEAYSEYLGDRQAALLTTLAEQRRRLAAKVDEITALKEQSKTKPQANGLQQTTLFSTDGANDEPAPSTDKEPAPVSEDRNSLDWYAASAYEPNGTDVETIPDDTEPPTCPNCGGTDIDETGTCLHCFEPDVTTTVETIPDEPERIGLPLTPDALPF